MSNFDNSLRRDATIRRKNVMRKILDLKKTNPNKVYSLIRVDEDYDPQGTNEDNYRDAGWEPVIDAQSVLDSRSNAPDNSNEDSLRKHPLTKSGKGKSEFLVMSIDKDRLHQNEVDRAARTLEKYKASSTGRKIVKDGNQIKMIDSEVNESNMNDNLEV